jgi:hypothetical protein
MYEWGISADRGGQQRLSPVGVTDDEVRARERMLEALGGLPAGVAATGWVTVLDFVLCLNGYDRYQSPVIVLRDSSGALRWRVGGGDE